MMRKDRAVFIVAFLLIVSGLGAFSVVSYRRHRPLEQKFGDTVRCLLDISSIQDTTHSLFTGYHYNLLREYAISNGKTASIRMSNLDMEPLDSLLRGCVDMIAMPASEAAFMDSTITSVPIDSSVVWVMRDENEADMVAANIWLGQRLSSPKDSSDRARFFHPFGYHHSGYTGFISPYDSLIKVQADSIGWDWRMLAAVVYIESWFHIEARSYRGAEGLLQLMPVTAARFGSDDTLDPEKSLMAGSHYLARLHNRYKKLGGNMEERFKFTAAAYNAGEGRIDDCIKYAEHRGKNPSDWATLVELIPEMRNDSIASSGAVRLGVFKGYETIAYVEQVMQTYKKICALCPEQK